MVYVLRIFVRNEPEGEPCSMRNPTDCSVGLKLDDVGHMEGENRPRPDSY